jgi:hypothetical protein
VWHPGPDDLALAALPAEDPPPEVLAHLATCRPCTDEVEQLRRTVALGRAAGSLEDPPPPPDRVWDAVVAELGEELRPPPATVTDLGARRRTGTARSRWRRAVLPAATAAAGLAAGLAIGAVVPDAPATVTIAQAPLAPLADPGASGRAQLVESADGREVVVDVVDPLGTLPGTYLEAWLMDPAGTRLHALGALTRQADGTHFHGRFALPADVPLRDFDTVDVSIERWDGDPTHSGASRLRGTVV